MTTMTKTQILAIARATKSLAGNGGFALFADGTMSECFSSNDVIARGNGRGGWEYRIAYIDRPATVADIVTLVGADEEARELPGAG